MLGHIEEWFYGDLAGIQSTSPGYATLRIRPFIPAGLEWVKASTGTVRGRAASEWRVNAGGGLSLNISVPVGSRAEVWVPAARVEDVSESGVASTSAPGVTFLRNDNGYVVFAVGSGDYAFTVSGTK